MATGVLVLLLSVVLLVNLTPVQNFIAHKAAAILADKLKTKVSIGSVRIDLLNHLDLRNVFIEDKAHDTLLSAGEVEIRITDWFIFKDKHVIHYIGLKNVYSHLYRTRASADWNYDFIADAFSTDKKEDTSVRTNPIEFDLKKVALDNVRFHYDDAWGGEDLDFDLGKFDVDAKGIDFKKKLIDITDIQTTNTIVAEREFRGGKPRRKHSPEIDTVDNTPFNTGNWSVNLHSIILNSCTYTLTMDDKVPDPNVFDQNHLIIKKIAVDAEDVTVRGDTIRGQLEKLHAEDRCGIVIRQMRSKITVSPNASICENLYLETNNSKIRDYYAMRYKRFPDFTSYIDSVVMEGHLKDAYVDKKDIAFFAPQLNVLPEIAVRVTGDGKGTVANLYGKNLMVSDGNTVIKGNLTMKGLPDIYKTWITYTDGEIVTNGKGILRYAPMLKNSPDISLESISYAYFKGAYAGYIENFAVKGILNTNLGSISTDIKMDIPGFNSNTAVYKGSLSANGFMIGTLLKQPLLGSITLNEDVSGNSFNPDHIQLNVDGTVKEISFNKYDYTNIITHGTIAKKQFNGKLQVDDPNLALEFDGGLNYNDKNIVLNATAHLLWGNLYALKLTSDTITAAADFDLNCTGSNIDNFSGFAKLNNIDMKRNSHKLALDSIQVNSSGNDTNKLLTIQSNDVVATIKGDYQLSKLPASVQYYLSRYIPNYIKVPAKEAPNQNLSFNIRTITIDSLLAVTIPIIRGFDSSTFSGSLNTTEKRLTLNANVPFGTIGKFHMSKIAITGQGNLDEIGLNAMVDNVSIGDSTLNGSLSVTTTLGNDSVAFTIATTSPDAGSALTLNGQILARKDSLFLTLLPSQFFLNQAKWDIAGGSKVVYSDKYLVVHGLSLSSGLQKISAETELQNNDKSLVISTENLDLGQLGSWAGLAIYQPDGRVNGTITINKIFQDLYVSANIKATDVKLGTDTVGTINIIGDYDGAKQLITFDPQTGIYRNNASVAVSGNISFDSATHQKLDGNIQFNNAPVVWASPFLVGILSHLSGTLNGNIAFGGTAYDPQISGTIDLEKCGLKLDYMGCYYTIPTAKIDVTNRRISFGNVQMLDSHNNPATLTGHFSHNMFRNMRMHLNARSDKFEVMNLTFNDNSLFYGNVIAGMDSVVLKGPFNDMKLNVYNIRPAAKSHIFIPISSSADAGSSFSYASFKTYGTSQEKIVQKSKDKFYITIDANLNSLAELTIVLDPSTGDAITARGSGQLQMDIPPNNDIRINGRYLIDQGTYTFTLKRLFVRQFLLDNDGTIDFNGPFSDTKLSVNAVYRAKARLYDLLSDADKTYIAGSELIDAQTPQYVDVLLHMNGNLNKPVLTFDLDLEDKHSQGSLAYRKLTLINYDDQQKFNQVSSLLLINDFVPQDGIGGSTVATGVINNISQVVSASTSTVLTTALNRLTGDSKVNVNVNYTNYNYSDLNNLGGVNRNQVKVGVNKSYLNDRLVVELGSTSDWGKPTSAGNTSNFNLTGDFRLQYLLTQTSGLRLNCFRTSDYDVTLDRDIIRSGVGISWKKSFDNFGDFFHGNKYIQKQKEDLQLKLQGPTDSSGKKEQGTE